MIYSKKDKVELVKKIMNVIHKISKISGLSMNSIGHWIRSFHFTAPFFCLFAIIYGPLYIIILTVLFLLSVISFFFIFNGCILSRLEMEILKDEYCITDPALEICRLNITNINRYRISYVVVSIYVLLSIFIIYLRFLKKNDF